MTKQEAEIKRVIENYFKAFNTHSLAINDEITTEDWYHIDPSGDWKKGRDEAAAQLREVHSTFLKNVKKPSSSSGAAENGGLFKVRIRSSNNWKG